MHKYFLSVKRIISLALACVMLNGCAATYDSCPTGTPHSEVAVLTRGDAPVSFDKIDGRWQYEKEKPLTSFIISLFDLCCVIPLFIPPRPKYLLKGDEYHDISIWYKRGALGSAFPGHLRGYFKSGHTYIIEAIGWRNYKVGSIPKYELRDTKTGSVESVLPVEKR